ncbi:RING-type E3 ubiquitin transferase [Sarracenia purpurea var. burkii]
MASSGLSYWCYRCNRFVRVQSRETIVCPDCGGGFVEEIDSPNQFPRPHLSPSASEILLNTSPTSDSIPRSRLLWRNPGNRSPFNPVIVLRGTTTEAPAGSQSGTNYELYYDYGDGTGLRPLPSSMSEFLMGAGLDRLLDQLSQLETHGVRRLDHPPASKAAIESLPTIKITASLVTIDSHCAVCKEQFELDAEAREMPCKHIYHPDCIVPWLSIRNSCPVCRLELPTDVNSGGRNSPVTQNLQDSNGERSVGLTIWRLPGGGFAVGRFTGGRGAAEPELPVVYTEMDGGFNGGGAPRMIARTASATRGRERSRLSRAFRKFFSLFRRIRFSSSHFRLEIGFRRSRSRSIFNNRLPIRSVHDAASSNSRRTRR